MDVPTADRARELATELGDAVTFYKIGLELMMSGEYFELLDWLLARDKKVFCDLKFFDIPATVGSAVRQLKDRGATFVTVHGNRSIMEAAAENKGDSLKVLGVTVLTSLDRGDLDDRRAVGILADLHPTGAGTAQPLPVESRRADHVDVAVSIQVGEGGRELGRSRSRLACRNGGRGLQAVLFRIAEPGGPQALEADENQITDRLGVVHAVGQVRGALL